MKNAVDRFTEYMAVVIVVLIIAGVLVSAIMLVDQSGTCREGGYSRAAIIGGRVYCVRVVDCCVDGKPFADVVEQMKIVPDACRKERTVEVDR